MIDVMSFLFCAYPENEYAGLSETILERNGHVKVVVVYHILSEKFDIISQTQKPWDGLGFNGGSPCRW